MTARRTPLLLLLAASCASSNTVDEPSPATVAESAAQPMPESPGPATAEAPEPAAVERTPPDVTSEFEDMADWTSPLDLGNGWVAFGIDGEGGVQAIWFPDGGEPTRQDDVVVHPETRCSFGLGISVTALGDYLELGVDCGDGADVIGTESVSYLLTGTPPDQLRVKWSGLVSTTDSNQVNGCIQSDGGRLELRGDEVWRVTKPWSEKTEPLEPDLDPECGAPGVPEEARLF